MIREATIADFDFLFDLCLDMCKMAGYEKGGLVVDRNSFDLFMEYMITNPDCIIFIAELGGKPIASIGLISYPWEHNLKQKIVSEEWWYVHPDHRGDLGLAKALINLALWWAKQKGAISLWMAATNDERVKKFYRRNGFNEAHSIFIKEIKDGS